MSLWFILSCRLKHYISTCGLVLNQGVPRQASYPFDQSVIKSSIFPMLKRKFSLIMLLFWMLQQHVICTTLQLSSHSGQIVSLIE